MKRNVLSLTVLLLLAFACDREPSVTPAIQLTGASECKGHQPKAASDSVQSDCIQFTWLKGDTLEIRHINAGFNCCPGGFSLQLRVSGDTLIIGERENSALCDCDCLFDLDYYLTGITRQTWWMRVVEPYVDTLREEVLLFRIDLTDQVSGTRCVNRSRYPWGT